MTGRTEDDPLDRLEDTANGYLRTAERVYGPAADGFLAGAFFIKDVLALVAVARAARDTGWRDADGLCWCEKSAEITGSPHRPQCARMRAALARLEEGS